MRNGIIQRSILPNLCTGAMALLVLASPTSSHAASSGIPNLDVQDKERFCSNGTCRIGDMIFDVLDETKLKAATRGAVVWPSGIIRYRFHNTGRRRATSSQRDTFLKACGEWEAKTGAIRCVEAGPDDRHYIYVETLPPRSKYSGRAHVGFGNGGKRIFQAQAHIWKNYGKILHELGHVIGLSHEHQRSDAPKFVRYYKRNARCCKSQLRPSKGGAHHTPYDYCSVMHYSRTAFAIKRRGRYRITLKPRKPITGCRDIGRYAGLSDGDCRGVQHLYGAVQVGCRR